MNVFRLNDDSVAIHLRRLLVATICLRSSFIGNAISSLHFNALAQDAIILRIPRTRKGVRLTARLLGLSIRHGTARRERITIKFLATFLRMRRCLGYASRGSLFFNCGVGS